MLVHHCAACGALSLNRLAAGDSPARVWEVFETSLEHPPAAVDGIEVLGATQRAVVRARVLGNEVPE
jgi:hypothetical protein